MSQPPQLGLGTHTHTHRKKHTLCSDAPYIHTVHINREKPQTKANAHTERENGRAVRTTPKPPKIDRTHTHTNQKKKPTTSNTQKPPHNDKAQTDQARSSLSLSSGLSAGLYLIIITTICVACVTAYRQSGGRTIEITTIENIRRATFLMSRFLQTSVTRFLEKKIKYFE